MDSKSPEEFREFSEPQQPRRIPRFLTYIVFMSSALWLFGVYVVHLHPSRTTFAGALILLMLYSGESLAWSFRRRSTAKPEPRHAKWIQR